MPQNSLDPAEAVKVLGRIQGTIEDLKPLMKHAQPRVINNLQRIDNAFNAMFWALDRIATIRGDR